MTSAFFPLIHHATHPSGISWEILWGIPISRPRGKNTRTTLTHTIRGRLTYQNTRGHTSLSYTLLLRCSVSIKAYLWWTSRIPEWTACLTCSRWTCSTPPRPPSPAWAASGGWAAEAVAAWGRAWAASCGPVGGCQLALAAPACPAAFGWASWARWAPPPTRYPSSSNSRPPPCATRFPSRIPSFIWRLLMVPNSNSSITSTAGPNLQHPCSWLQSLSPLTSPTSHSSPMEGFLAVRICPPSGPGMVTWANPASSIHTATATTTAGLTMDADRCPCMCR